MTIIGIDVRYTVTRERCNRRVGEMHKERSNTHGHVQRPMAAGPTGIGSLEKMIFDGVVAIRERLAMAGTMMSEQCRQNSDKEKMILILIESASC